ERRTGLELVDQLGGFGLQPRGDLVFTPARFDLFLDLVQRAIARGRNPGDVVPDIAAVDLEQIVVDTDIGIEGGRYHLAGKREIHDLAAGLPAGTIDIVRGDRQLQFLGDLRQRRAAGALVFNFLT